jgi:hypothetical protein
LIFCVDMSIGNNFMTFYNVKRRIRALKGQKKGGREGVGRGDMWDVGVGRRDRPVVPPIVEIVHTLL